MDVHRRSISILLSLRLVVLVVVCAFALSVSAQDEPPQSDDGTISLGGGATAGGLIDPVDYLSKLGAIPYTPLSNTTITANDLTQLNNGLVGIVLPVKADTGEPLNIIVSADPAMADNVVNYVNNTQVYFAVQHTTDPVAAFGINVDPMELFRNSVVGYLADKGYGDTWIDQMTTMALSGEAANLREFLQKLTGDDQAADNLASETLGYLSDMVDEAVKAGTLNSDDGNSFLDQTQGQYSELLDMDLASLSQSWLNAEAAPTTDYILIEIDLGGEDEEPAPDWFVYYSIQPQLIENISEIYRWVDTSLGPQADNADRYGMHHLAKLLRAAVRTGYNARSLTSAKATLNVSFIHSGSVSMQMWTPKTSYYNQTVRRTSTGQSPLSSQSSTARCYDVATGSTDSANRATVDGGWQVGSNPCPSGSG